MACRSWVFTLNNPKYLLDPSLFPSVGYCIYSEESAENGTHHYQGYIEFIRAVRLATCVKLIPKAHFEPRRGSQQQAIDYASKLDGSHIDGPYEYGKPSAGQGSRTDLLAIKKALDEGSSMKAVSEDFFSQFVRYHRGLAEYSLLHLSTERRKPLVSYYYGQTGTGKSFTCHLLWPNAYWKAPNKWWGGFLPTDTIILDDFYGWIPFHDMLRLLDGYPLRVETKGGEVPVRSDRIIITSNRLPTELYRDTRLDPAALIRRIDRFLLFPGIDETPLKFHTYAEFLENI